MGDKPSGAVLNLQLVRSLAGSFEYFYEISKFSCQERAKNIPGILQ